MNGIVFSMHGNILIEIHTFKIQDDMCVKILQRDQIKNFPYSFHFTGSCQVFDSSIRVAFALSCIRILFAAVFYYPYSDYNIIS